MLLAAILFAIGLFILIKGANWLISGASSISLRLNVKPIVIGLTVVAFGTSAPELVVSVTSHFTNNEGIILGNLIGSNIANILLILGVAALISTLHVERNTILKEIPMSVLGVTALLILGMREVINFGGGFKISSIFFENNMEGVISRADGFLLLLFFIIFLYYTVTIAKGAGDGIVSSSKKTLIYSIASIVAGLLGLIFGSKLTVDNAVIIARFFNVSDNFIGLTLIAVGTSLPELVTSIVAAFKKNIDILIGNVIGSNIFNVLFVLGIASVIRPIPFYTPSVLDAIVLFFATIVLFLSLFVNSRHKIIRPEGLIMIVAYFLYIGFIIVRE